MKEFYNGISSKELLRFFSLDRSAQKDIKSEMIKEMYKDLHAEGFRHDVIKDKIVQAFSLPNYAAIFRYFKLSDLQLEKQAKNV